MRRKTCIITVKRFITYTLLFTILVPFAAMAKDKKKVKPEDRMIDMDSPTFVPMVRVSKVMDDATGDSIQYVEMNNVYVYGPMEFKNDKQRDAYNRLVYNVKRVLPIAKEVNKLVLQTYEELEALPDKKSRDRHLKERERQLKAEYTPRLKKLTFSQGKLLIKLVYRETNSSSYQLVQAFLGSTKAVFYQSFAWMLGASLKKEYDPKGKDKLTERVVRLVEAGQL